MFLQLWTECGVRFVVVEALPGSKIDGACFWLGKSPVIGMSLQRDRIDNFWFVLRHEIEHILEKHGKDIGIIDSDLESDMTDLTNERLQEEEIANSAARDFCVPIDQMDDFINRKKPFFFERDIVGFARKLQIHPGIVAGQLRKQLNKWNLFTKMLVKIRHNITSGAVADGWGDIYPISV